jgi:hypothetical protein
MLSKLGLPLSPRYVLLSTHKPAPGWFESRAESLTLAPPSRISAHIVVAVCVIVIVVNLLEAIQLAYLWTALKWEPETEWDEWRMNGVRVAVGLVCGYLLWTCCAALVGLVGALRVRAYAFLPRHGRLLILLAFLRRVRTSLYDARAASLFLWMNSTTHPIYDSFVIARSWILSLRSCSRSSPPLRHLDHRPVLCSVSSSLDNQSY